MSKGGIGRAGGATGAYLRLPGPKWVQTPKWHWRYWFGYRMRSWHNEHGTMLGEYDAEWVYRTFGQHARAVLEEQSNVGHKQQNNDGGRSANYIGGASSLGAGRSTF